MNQYEVKLDVFHGPLDLLLHLIKELEIDIYDIQMSLITEQYMNYIHKMKELEINIASEYLVMASELLRIKSKMLLPEPPIEEEELDPREELVTQLLEYQNYKLYADQLKQLKKIAERKFVKAPHEFEETDVSEKLTIKLNDLLEAYNKVRSRVELDKPTQVYVEKEPYTHEDALRFLSKRFKFENEVNIKELFTENVHLKEVVQVFITLLELVTNHIFKINRHSQNNYSFVKLKEHVLWN